MMMRAGAAAGACANGSGRSSAPCARCPRLTPTSTPLTQRPQAFGGGRSDGNSPASPHPGYSTDRARTLQRVQEQPQKQDATKDVVRADSMAGPGSSPLYRRGTVCAVVLGGGESDSRRLFPLTKNRTLPAIPVGSVFRLIDIPISNLLNSGINKIYVLTQYNSTSLNRYLHSTYNYTGLPTALGGFVETVAATQGPQEQRWAESAADTVRQWYNLFANSPHLRLIEDVLVLPSDQVYRMDFEELINFHRANDADLTLVCQPVRESDADHFGIMKLEGCDIVTFEEKPRGEAASNMSMDFMDLSELLSEPHLNPGPNLEPRWKKLKNLGSSPGSKTFIGSCGMYIFKKDSMRDLLKANPQARDFGSELIPAAVKAGMKVSAFLFPDYFVDVGGSIQEYYNFNISLAKQQVPFSFTEDVCNEKPFYNSSSQLPPNVYERVKIQGAMLGTGCTLTDCTITNSVVGSRSIIGSGTVIEDSIVMGSDYFEHEKSWSRQVGPSFPPMGIGANCTIKRAIVDKNSRIGNDVKLVNTEGVYESMDRMARGIAIRDGIIIVSKSSVVPDGTVV